MSRITEKNLEDAIFDWLDEILGLWEIGSATPRVDGQIIMVWHMQHMARYETPILMGRINAINRIGRDAISAPDHNGDSTMGGTREFVLYLEYFGNDAMDVMSKIKDATEDPQYLAILYDEGITPVESSPIAEAHTFLGTTPEDRTLMDIRLRTTADWTTNRGLPIEEIVGNGFGYSDGGILDTGTITIDVSTLTTL
jgi:hypothetical protein